MVDPVIPQSKEQLKEGYNLSSRTAIRVAALWQRGLGISEGVLEDVSPGEPLEKLLLSEDLMEQAEDLTTEKLRQILEPREEKPEPNLKVEQQEKHRVLCLLEEVLASQVWTGESDNGSETGEPSSSVDTEDSPTIDIPAEPDDVPATPDRPVPTPPDDDQRTPAVFEEEETMPLFGDEEVSELKLTILTGVDTEEKVEAIRKLQYAPVEDTRKGMVLLQALTDESEKVREEAALSLENLGLSDELSEAVRTFLTGDLEQKKYAGDKIQNLIEGADDFEKATVVALLVTDLREHEEAEVHRVILKTLRPLAPFIGTNAQDHLPRVTRTILQALVSNFEEIHRPVRRLYRDLGEAVPEKVSSILWEEVQNVNQRVLKAYLLILLGEMPLPDDLQQSVPDEMVATISDWSDTETECRRLGNALIQQGEEGVRSIIDGWEGDRQQKVFLLRLLDEMLIDVDPDPDIAGDLESFLIGVTKIQDRNIREPLMELRLLYHRSLSVETKREVAEELFETLHRFKNERIARMTPILLEKMGVDILPLLLDYLRDPTYDVQREVALEVLGSLFEQVEPDEQPEEKQENIQSSFEHFMSFLEEHMEEDGDERGQMMVQQARALSGPVPDRDMVRNKWEELTEQIKNKDEPYAAIEALGWIVSSSRITAEEAMDTGILFLNYLESDLPEDISEEREEGSGRRLLVHQQSTAYTELIPSVIDGLSRICQREELKDSFREKMVSSLLDKWHDVVEFKIVWGPGTITRLAEHFGDMCRCPYIQTELKEQMLEGLSRKIDNLSIVEIVGDILGEGLESGEIRNLSRKMTGALLEMTEMPDYQDPEDRRILLENLGKICSRRNIAGDRKENKHLRKKIIDALIDGLYDQVDGVVPTLERLAKAETVPEKYRDQIQETLDRYGLSRAT